MAARRIYVVWTSPLFYDSLLLLLRHPQIECLGGTADRSAARTQLQALQPDTILVEAEKDRVSADALQILQACTWDARVIGLSLADNKLSMFCRQQCMMTQSEDLFRLVLADTP